jgi:hypothetical protein
LINQPASLEVKTMGIQVTVEVTETLMATRKGGRQQVVYVDTGGKYPEQASIYVGEQGPLKAGRYVATKLRKNGFRFELDLFELTGPHLSVSAK